jgi:TatD DNase family protein
VRCSCAGWRPELPLGRLVLETDAPDIPPHWLYTPAEQRAAGQPQGRNAPAELPRIAPRWWRSLRGMAVAALAAGHHANACAGAAAPGGRKKFEVFLAVALADKR